MAKMHHMMGLGLDNRARNVVALQLGKWFVRLFALRENRRTLNPGTADAAPDYSASLASLRQQVTHS